MTTVFIVLAVIAGLLAFVEFKKPGTVKSWFDSIKSRFGKKE